MLREIQPGSRISPLDFEELGLSGYQKVKDLPVTQQVINHLAQQPRIPIAFDSLITSIRGTYELRCSENWLEASVFRARKFLDEVESPFQIYTLLRYKMFCIEKRFAEKEERLIGGAGVLVERVHPEVQPLLERCLTARQVTIRGCPYNLKMALSPMELEMLGMLVAKYPNKVDYNEFSIKLYGVEDIGSYGNSLSEGVSKLKHGVSQKVRGLTNSRYDIASVWQVGYTLILNEEEQVAFS